MVSKYFEQKQANLVRTGAVYEMSYEMCVYEISYEMCVYIKQLCLCLCRWADVCDPDVCDLDVCDHLFVTKTFVTILKTGICDRQQTNYK